MLRVTLLATVWLASFVSGKVEYEFLVGRDFIYPDCVEKLGLTINGQFPGPEIRGEPGEEVSITVRNNLISESINVHWHGMHQKDTPWMDGITGISSCPIAPSTEFTYDFTLNESPGTYLYHIHTGVLSESGARGALIIEDKKSDYAGEFTMLVSDWYHRDTYHSQHGLLQTDFRWVFNPQSILVNGRAEFDCEENDDYTCDDEDICLDNINGEEICPAYLRPYTRWNSWPDVCSEDNCPGLEEFEVESGKTYLFRMINMSPLNHLNIAFQGHTTKVVATDGHPVEPIDVTSVDIHSGQRADIEVTMNNSDAAYWINIRTRSRSPVRYGQAILRYAGVDSEEMPSGDPTDLGQPDWDDYDFTRDQQNAYQSDPSVVDDPPSNDDVDRRFLFLITQERFDIDMDSRIAFNGDSDIDLSDMQSIIGEDGNRPEDNCDSTKHLRWAFNRNSFIMKDTPLLLSRKFTPQVWNEEPYNSEKYGFFKLEKGKVYDIVIQNYPACNGVCEVHPTHKHADHFWVLGHFTGEWSGSEDQINDLCTTQCDKRDTTMLIADDTVPALGGCGYTVIRFIADSPGVWPLHCHQSWHFLMGQIGIFYYDEDTIALPDIEDGVALCGNVDAFDYAAGFGNEGMKEIRRRHKANRK